jgi:outer membrane protein assembly factor BamD
MTFIYNQFAESELSAASWYIEREAYVAAINRAKWVFQYYPLSESVPEAIAILAYSHEKLGLTDLAKEYKTLLQINYPNWLTSDGRVKLNTKRDRTWFNKLTFGKLGRSGIKDSSVSQGNYTGATKTQVVRNANQLRLPNDNATNANAANANAPLNTSPTNRIGGINVGLGLPEASSERVTNQASTGSTAREANVDPQNINPTRRTTLSDENNSDSIRLTPMDNDIVIEEAE